MFAPVPAVGRLATHGDAVDTMLYMVGAQGSTYSKVSTNGIEDACATVERGSRNFRSL